MNGPTSKQGMRFLSNEQWKQTGRGLAFGSMIGILFALLGGYDLVRINDLFLATGLAGALIGLTRARKLLPILTWVCLAVVAVIAYTPLMTFLVGHWNRTDVIPVDLVVPAVVVLSSHVQKAQTLDSHALERTVRGYELLREGHAARLVMTEADLEYGSQVPIVRAQMRILDLAYPVDSVGPVHNTHDEAVAVARLAKERHWTVVLLVTQPWHMRRSAAVFEKAGIHVVCASCVEGSYDLNALEGPWSRLSAFRDWLHEVVGYQVYRLHGWI